MPRLNSVQLDSRALQGYLDGQHGVDRELMARAERVLAAAQADPHDDTYAFEHGLAIEIDQTDRMRVKVISKDWKGHVLEAKYGILAKALDAGGGA